MSETPDLESTADRVVAALRNIDGKVNAKRDQRLNDPDSFGDKIFKSVVPTLAGLVLGKAFEMVWKKKRRPQGRPCRRYQERGCGSGARHRIRRGFRRFGALVSQLSGRGSKAIVDRRHARQAHRK